MKKAAGAFEQAPRRPKCLPLKVRNEGKGVASPFVSTQNIGGDCEPVYQPQSERVERFGTAAEPQHLALPRTLRELLSALTRP